ncbi:MAG TPA: DUF418 domain-containing protein, partial [Acidobacteriota bacterium]|nr:DUF418 domain-containing protein [Acidobacteriota bacterium]
MASENRQSLPALGPVSSADRIDAIDTLRGVALLGILTINITAYALPFAAYFNPQAAGGATGINLVMWFFSHILFESKMMAIFSMLFGAGMILMYERAQAAGRPFGGIYYRRIWWLLVIGLLHAYVLWYGDILVTYAVCGLLLYLFRRRSPRTLIILGLLTLLFGGLLRTGSGYNFGRMQEQANKLDEKIATGYEPSAGELSFRRDWDGLKRGFAPSPEQVAEDAEKMRGDAGTVLKTNAAASVLMHTQALPFMLLWRGLSMMLLGMGLMKLGVFSAERSKRFYALWTILGFGVGLPIVAYGAFRLEAHDFDFIQNFFIDGHFNYFGSVLVAMGYVSLVMLLYKSGVLGG